MRRLTPLLLVLAALLPAPAGASATDVGTITASADTITWPGRTWRTDDAPAPEAFRLTLDLPAGYWDAHDGGVEIAIRWTSEYNVLDLYVFDEHGGSWSATGFPTSAESLIIPRAANGSYRIVVVPSAIQIDTGFEALAQVELRTAQAGALVPDLVPLPPDELKLAAGAFSFMPVEWADTGGCYPDEIAESPTPLTRCLRFDAGVANLGDGPFELRLDLSTLPVRPTVWQDVYDRDGNRVVVSDAGTYTWHATHAHVHYEGFASYALHELDQNGGIGDEVVAARKADFCMIDTRLLYWADGPRGNGARNHHFPDCNLPGGDGAGATEMRQGIDVGWADVYTWDLPGQYIDVSGVPAGDYAVVVTVNPDGELLEDPSNNVAFTKIRLDQSGVATL